MDCFVFQLSMKKSTVKDGDFLEATRWQCFRTFVRLLENIYLSVNPCYNHKQKRPSVKSQSSALILKW